ncbi:MAG: S8 family serine peptidase [Coleofasciculaceae cyanobacterium]
MNNSNLSTTQPETTGRYLVLLQEDAVEAGIQVLNESAGVRNFVKATQFEGSDVTADVVEGTDTLVFDSLGVAVVTAEPDQFMAMSTMAEGTSPIIAVEPERVVYALSDTGFNPPGQPVISGPSNLSLEYLRGYRDAIVNLVDNLSVTSESSEVKQAALEETELTWGLQITKAAESPFSGRGVKVAILDTGFDLTHPDFAGRQVTTSSFITNEEVQDKQGHGTHCIGTACGPRTPLSPPGYGVAYNAEIYAGKVLSNRGSGSDGGILAGIQWAVANGCQVISMSLGARTFPGQRYSRVFEAAAKRALRRGSLIIAAAGNESRRDMGRFNPVGHPANCPSIMAVGALDIGLKLGFFSNRGFDWRGGQVDIAGPGVNIFSSWPMPTRYNTISGTSMATPHVSGIAALYAEANPYAGPEVLWSLITQNSRRLMLPSVDVGSGLAQAPC